MLHEGHGLQARSLCIQLEHAPIDRAAVHYGPKLVLLIGIALYLRHFLRVELAEHILFKDAGRYLCFRIQNIDYDS